MRLFEKYRPAALSEIIGQDKAVRKLGIIARTGIGGKAFWFSGATGTGKTSMALILANEIADDVFIMELDAGKLTPARLDDIEAESHFAAWGKGGRAYVVNEAHGLSAAAIRQLLVMLERIPSHVAWIFTTTNDGEEKLFDNCDDGFPLLSRCAAISLTNQGLADALAPRLAEIAAAENLGIRPPADFKKLMQRNKNNVRACLQAIEGGEFVD